ncbi:hypothetical protein KC332_g16 [Hortaea werneckii]|nr:hypothetical protein KC348_g22 [Hortaea werneckii]KAI7421946.1 hypothetical protein KC332_g16 [Hortaea werneckii]
MTSASFLLPLSLRTSLRLARLCHRQRRPQCFHRVISESKASLVEDKAAKTRQSSNKWCHGSLGLFMSVTDKFGELEMLTCRNAFVH